jgi:hypothetical protein
LLKLCRVVGAQRHAAVAAQEAWRSKNTGKVLIGRDFGCQFRAVDKRLQQ